MSRASWRRTAPWLIAATAGATALFALPAAAASSSAAASRVSVRHVGLVTEQDVPAQPGSEPDTVVEPDVAVSPINPRVAVAAAHDGRYPNGGAVGITYAWTHDGGATWHHAPVPGLTTSTGGPEPWVRASDPVVAFAPNGDVYISTLLIAFTCPSAVAVSRSTNGGRTFAAPVLAHYSADCALSDDKNTLIIDNSPTSPHEGRLYQFWTPFLTNPLGQSDGSPQALVYSDDHGQTWSEPVDVSLPHANTQNSTPMLLADGTLVDAFIDYGDEAQENEDIEFRHHEAAANRAARAPGTPVIRTAVSHDGGDSFTPGGVVARGVSEGPPGIRCCLDAATTDVSVGRMYVAWNSTHLSRVKVASSTDGTTWSRPRLVNRPSDEAQNGVNVDVAAQAGKLAVSYGLTNADTTDGRFAQQYVAVSRDGGTSFSKSTPIGPQSDYAYAAQAGGIFPGDYIGTAMAASGRLYAVWCWSGQPTAPGATYHQVVEGAVLSV